MADDTRLPKPEGERADLPSWVGGSSQPANSTTTKLASSTDGSSSKPDASYVPAKSAGSNLQSKSPRRQEIVNEMPGGTANTAGGEKIQDYSAWSVLKSIRPSEFAHFHRLPCVRDALLTGIGCGFGTGGLAFVLGRATWTACSWSVYGFIGSSFGMFEYCKAQIRREKAGMKMAVEVMDAKRMEKDKRLEEARERRRREKREQEDAEERARLEEQKRKSQWYRFW